MGMSGFNKSSSRSGRRASYMPLSEINVTPFVDVMLVLLIVFMIAAPLLTVGVDVNLPDANASAINDETTPLVVTIDKAGTIYVQESSVEFDKLIPLLSSITDHNLEAKIFIRGDQSIQYGTIMQVMGQINTAGFKKVSLITDPFQSKR